MAINSFIFLDFETGGLDPKKNAVTEVAMVAVKGDTLEKIDLVSTFIKPYGEYTYEDAALKHTGITMDDIEGGMPVEKAVEEIIELFKKADLHPKKKSTRNILIAQNSGFDKGFLIQLFHHTGKLKDLEKLTYGTTDFYGNYQPEMFDTIPFFKLAFGHDEEMNSYKLENCLEKAGIELPDAHKAVNDTIAMKDLVVLLTGKLRSEGGESSEAVAGTRFREHFQF